MKTDRNKILNLLIYVVSIMILLWLLFISIKDMITSSGSFNQHFNPSGEREKIQESLKQFKNQIK